MIAPWFFVLFFYSVSSQRQDDSYAKRLFGNSVVFIGDAALAIPCNRYGMTACLLTCDNNQNYNETLLIAKVDECYNVEKQTANDCMDHQAKKYGPKCKNMGCQGWNSAAVVRNSTSPWPTTYVECVLTCDDALNYYCAETCVNQAQQMKKRNQTIDDVGSDQKCIMDALKTMSQCLKTALH